MFNFRVSDHGDKQIHRKAPLPIEGVLHEEQQLADPQHRDGELHEEQQLADPQHRDGELHEEQQLADPQLRDGELHEEQQLADPQLRDGELLEEQQLQLVDPQQQLQLLQQLQNLGLLQQLLNGGLLQQLQQQQLQYGGQAQLVMVAPLPQSNVQEEEETGNLTDFESKFWYPVNFLINSFICFYANLELESQNYRFQYC
jgi:hypothetical protein